MTTELIPHSGQGLINHGACPGLVHRSGHDATKRYVDYFTVSIRNRHTRMAYWHGISEFFKWLEERLEKREVQLSHLKQVEPIMVAAYIEQHSLSRPTVKQHLSAIRKLFDWLVINQVVPVNPAGSVRGPRHVVKRGKTPVLSPEEMRALIEHIDTTHVVGLRDRALMGVMFYGFPRVGAVVGLNVADYYPSGKRYRLRFENEKGGKYHEIPVHHKAEEYLDTYISAAGIEGERKAPLFQSAVGKTKQLTGRRLRRENVFHMIRRRARDAGVNGRMCCHSFRASGITTYLQNGGTLERAQAIAAHESTRTTQLYNRCDDEITLAEIERIQL